MDPFLPLSGSSLRSGADIVHHLIAETGIGPGTEEELGDAEKLPLFNADMPVFLWHIYSVVPVFRKERRRWEEGPDSGRGGLKMML